MKLYRAFFSGRIKNISFLKSHSFSTLPRILLLLSLALGIGSFSGYLNSRAVSGNRVQKILADSDNWGLSFQKKGEAPIGNATVDELASQHAYFRKETDEKILYLTFDYGYENGNTQKILDALKKHHVKTTFFTVGTVLEHEPEFIRQIVADGHTIGNHTMTHPNMSKISNLADFQKELDGVSMLYREITGEEMPLYYRPPQGIYNKENLQMAKELGYHTFFWSLAYVDWIQDQQPSKEEAFAKLLERIHPGAIVLLHSTSATNAEILDELLTRWEDMGYRFGTLDEFF